MAHVTLSPWPLTSEVTVRKTSQHTAGCLTTSSWVTTVCSICLQKTVTTNHMFYCCDHCCALQGMTALHIAAENGHPELVEILLSHGTRVDSINLQVCCTLPHLPY